VRADSGHGIGLRRAVLQLTPRVTMPPPRRHVWPAITAVAVAAAVGAGGYAWMAVAERATALQDMRTEQARWQQRQRSLETERENLLLELEAALRIGERLSDRVDTLERDLAEARATRLDVREIRSPAEFPIERAMAEAGDTVSGFAAREGTTEAVVRALNPWLKDAETLEAFQTLWVPKRP